MGKRERTRGGTAALAAALGLMVAACGGNTGEDGRATTSSGGAATASGAAAAAESGAAGAASGRAAAATAGGSADGVAAGGETNDGTPGGYAVACDPEARDAAGRQPWMFYDQDGSDELCDCSLHADLVTEVSLECYCSFQACPTFEVALGVPTCPNLYTVVAGCGLVAITQPASEGPDHVLLYGADTHDLVGATIASDVSFGPCPATVIYHAGVYSLSESGCPDYARADLCDVRDCR